MNKNFLKFNIIFSIIVINAIASFGAKKPNIDKL